MGTRADFYMGRGVDAEWLGSIAWDGYPQGIAKGILEATAAQVFKHEVEAFLKCRSDTTWPHRGWPWPWEDSRTTDYAYAFDGGKVYGACFGHCWFDPLQPEPEDQPDDKECVFPNMSTRTNVRYDEGSGTIFLQRKA